MAVPEHERTLLRESGGNATGLEAVRSASGGGNRDLINALEAAVERSGTSSRALNRPPSTSGSCAREVCTSEPVTRTELRCLTSGEFREGPR